MYRWEPNGQRWEKLASEVDAKHQAVVATIRRLGTYALLAPPQRQFSYLPLLRR